MLLPLLLLGAGATAAIAAIVVLTRDRSVPQHEPDVALPAPPDASGQPSSTGYKLIDRILPALRAAASASGYPLGLIIGWIAGESGGRLSDTTRLDERGYFQLMPDESKALGIDHQRLSTDSAYSIDAGIRLIGKYAAIVDKYGVAPRGSVYYWKLVKLVHTVGGGDTKKLVDGAVTAGRAGSWEAFKAYALDAPNPKPKHSPKKWLTFIDDKIYRIGRPFGFGSESSAMVGAGPSHSPADVETLARAVESCCPRGTPVEKQAVAWAIRNRAARQGVPVAYLLAPEGACGPRGSGGRDYASTALQASGESSAIARAVMSLPESSDPTGGAVDFWCPAQQARLKVLGEARAAVLGVECDLPSVDEVRLGLAAVGLRPVMLVGTIELLGA